MRKLTSEDLDKISEIAVSAAQNFIFARVSKKEIIDLDVNVELNYNNNLDLFIVVDILFDDFSKADKVIADNAADYALEEVENFLAEET